MSNIIKHWFVGTNKSNINWKSIPFEVHLQKCNERPGLLWSILASRSASRSDGLFGGKGNHHLAKLIFTMVHFHILCYYTLFHTSTGYILEKAKFGPKQFHLDLCHFRLWFFDMWDPIWGRLIHNFVNETLNQAKYENSVYFNFEKQRREGGTSHSQMLGKVKSGLPAKIWRLVGCTEMLSW